MAGEMTLDSLTRQLAAVREQLLLLAPDDFAARYKVKCEQDRLRNIARVFARDSDSYRSTDDLRAELTTRRESLEMIRREAVYLREGATVNVEMREARGTAGLVQRIAHLEDLLSERGET